MSTCPHCGIGFFKWEDYQEHLDSHRHYKALETHPRALPKHHRNTSGRSKQQIVKDAEETWLQPYIITTSNEQEHLASCRCHACWLKLADKLIKSQEENLNG